MNKFLKTRQEWFLGATAVLLAGILVAAFIVGITDLALHLGTSVASKRGGGPGLSFDLNGAKRLDLKGLVQ